LGPGRSAKEVAVGLSLASERLSRSGDRELSVVDGRVVVLAVRWTILRGGVIGGSMSVGIEVAAQEK